MERHLCFKWTQHIPSFSPKPVFMTKSPDPKKEIFMVEMSLLSYTDSNFKAFITLIIIVNNLEAQKCFLILIPWYLLKYSFISSILSNLSASRSIFHWEISVPS